MPDAANDTVNGEPVERWWCLTRLGDIDESRTTATAGHYGHVECVVVPEVPADPGETEQ